jgi:hypothetical protein
MTDHPKRMANLLNVMPDAAGIPRPFAKTRRRDRDALRRWPGG